MDATLHCTAPCSRQERSVHSRLGVANTMDRFKGLESPWTSPRQIAGQLHVPARALNYWIHRERSFINHSSWPERTARFFETPEGIDVLHRLMAAAHLVFVEGNDCGLRNLSWFLELSRLSEFVASSYGAQQAAAEELESLLIRFGQEEDLRLAEQMPAREITLCEDETFHPQICLVAIEPVSNFILVEQYQPQRDTATWEQCTGAQLAALPVTVFQVTSDAAKALIAHAETSPGAHHSPDLFHVQYDKRAIDLKTLYAGTDAQFEVSLGDYRIDVMSGGRLVEIQHGSLAAIRDKVKVLLKNYPVVVVKPIIVQKLLVKRADKDGPVTGRRMSPKRGALLDLFDELVHFTRVFPHKGLTLEVPLVDIEEWRYPGHGRRRRWRLNDYQIEDQKLVAVHATYRFQTAADLLHLIERPLPQPFHTGHLAESLHVNRWSAQRIAYCFRQTGAVLQVGKQGNARLYEFAAAKKAG